jgi:hypothetical protein
VLLLALAAASASADPCLARRTPPGVGWELAGTGGYVAGPLGSGFGRAALTLWAACRDPYAFDQGSDLVPGGFPVSIGPAVSIRPDVLTIEGELRAAMMIGGVGAGPYAHVGRIRARDTWGWTGEGGLRFVLRPWSPPWVLGAHLELGLGADRMPERESPLRGSVGVGLHLAPRFVALQ